MHTAPVLLWLSSGLAKGPQGHEEAPEEGLEPPTRRLTAACSTN